MGTRKAILGGYDTLAAWREANGLTQREACEILHVPQACYSKWETGRSHPRPKTLRRVAAITGVPVAALMGVDVIQKVRGSRSSAEASLVKNLGKHAGSNSVCFDKKQIQIRTRFRSPDTYKRKSLRERLDARTDKSGGPDACWPISGCKIGLAGHAQITDEQGRRHPAHRAAWMLAHGPIPDGLVVCHKCDNPRCVNPTHLFLDTQAGNVRDSHRKGRFTAWHRTGRRLDGSVAKRYAHRFHDTALVGEIGAELIKTGDGVGELVQRGHGSQSARSAVSAATDRLAAKG